MKVYYEPYGCSQNIAETGMLASSLGEIVEEPEDADIIVIGTCIVIEHTEHRMLRRIEELKRYGKKVVVYGCLPSARREVLPEGVIPVRTWELPRAHEIIGTGDSPMNHIYTMDRVATVPIANGCLGSCTYCITRLARGHVRSFDPGWIKTAVKKALSQGMKEIRLSSQDTAAYGRDIGINLAVLLDNLTSLDYEFRIRVGMMEPMETLEILDPLISSYTSPKVYKFLHLPVQSGDDYILKRMNRGYTADDFLEIIHEFKTKIPDLLLSTDIIVGFPGETDESIERTKELIMKVKPEILNITRFSPRPKTPAYRWKRPSTNNVKRWSRELSELHFSILREINRKYLGKRFTVLVAQKGKRGNYVGRTDAYRPVILKTARLGEFHEVVVTGYRDTYLIGENP